VPELPPAVGGEALRTEWGWISKRVLGMFGFITPAKGHLVTLNALAQLPDDYVLLIAGGLRREQDRPILAALKRRIRALDLAGRVRITGYLAATDIPAHISACDMLVYPYTHADFSTSVVWGLAYQHVPVVISDIPTHRDLADWCGCVELFNSGDAAHLAHIVQQLAGAPSRQEALRQAARRWAQANSWTAIAQQTLEVYARAIQS
jgi:glycosyltransferase involved in cell wall biosynthesis